VGTAYFDALSLDEQVESEKAVVDAAQVAAKDLRSRVSLGRNRQAEQSSAEAQVARVQATLADLEGQRSQAREALASLCGVPTDQALVPLPAIAQASDAASPVDADVDALPLLRSAKQAVAVAEANRLAAKGGFFPSLYAEGNYYVARQNGVSGPAWDAVLGLDLPLFRGGATVARYKIADSQVQAAQLRLDLAKRDAIKEARQAWSGLKQAIGKAEANRLALEAAEKSYADQQKDFRNSLVTSLDLLNAFQSVESARLDTLKARYETHRAQLRYRLALGQTLP
jgi:outer membrane protein